MPSRLAVYRDLLGLARQRDYEIHGVASFWGLVRGGGIPSGRKYFVLRHDIDTGVRTAKAMWEIEKDLGIRSSYYFRLSTAAVELMREIHEGGSEVSYHFEEIATEAKRLCLGSEGDIRAVLPETREQFRRNLESLRARVGAPMRVVAAHGDWANRRLGVPNWVLLEDMDFRQDVGVDLEVYDTEFFRHVGSRHSDDPYPRFWRGGDPAEAFKAAVSVVYVLVHPRHWQVDRRDNFREDLSRALEGLQYRVGRRLRPRMSPISA